VDDPGARARELGRGQVAHVRVDRSLKAHRVETAQLDTAVEALPFLRVRGQLFAVDDRSDSGPEAGRVRSIEDVLPASTDLRQGAQLARAGKVAEQVQEEFVVLYND